MKDDEWQTWERERRENLNAIYWKKFLGFEISKMGMMCNSCEKLKMFALEAVFHYFKIMNMYGPL